jgi:hypothetical protein
MTRDQLNALAATVAWTDPGPWMSTVPGYESVVALMNAKDDLLALARRALDAEGRTCETCEWRHPWDAGLGTPDVCDLVQAPCADLGHLCGGWKANEGTL